jgi:hypothetical protein
MAASEPWIRSDAISVFLHLSPEVVALRANVARLIAQRALAESEKRPWVEPGQAPRKQTLDLFSAQAEGVTSDAQALRRPAKGDRTQIRRESGP